jgi:hypothetical protein
VKYRERVRLQRPASGAGAGAQDPDTGVYTPGTAGAPVILYDGAADVQHSGRAVVRTEGGQPTEAAEAVIFLRVRGSAKEVQNGDTGTVYWQDGTTNDFETSKVNWLDDSVLVRFL